MKLSIFFILAVLIFQSKAENSVKVSVYYETLCPDSIRFINKQLYQNYIAFGPDVVALELIPYGFAKESIVNGVPTITCQHGEEECYANKIQGCVIKTQPIEKSVEFVYCSESKSFPAADKYIKECATRANVTYDQIEECVASGYADTVVEENGKKTQQLNPSFIPAIVFNGKFNQQDQDQAMTDFKGVVCRYLDNKPGPCNSDKSHPKAILM